MSDQLSFDVWWSTSQNQFFIRDTSRLGSTVNGKTFIHDADSTTDLPPCSTIETSDGQIVQFLAQGKTAISGDGGDYCLIISFK